MFRHKVHCWRWLRPVEQAATAADELNLTDALRQRQIIKSRETDPVTHERKTIPKHQGKLGFLWITQAPIAEIELTWRMLLRDQETRRLEKSFLQVVYFPEAVVGPA
jgi:hypothetical protein